MTIFDLEKEEPEPRERPMPVRERGVVYAVYSNGYREKLDPLTAKNYADVWADAVGGAYVYLAMEIPDDL